MNSGPSPENNGGESNNSRRKSWKKRIFLKIISGLFAIVFIFVSYVMFRMYKQMRDMKEVFNAVEGISDYVVPVRGEESGLPDIPQSRMGLKSPGTSVESSRFKGGGDTSLNMLKFAKREAFIQSAKQMDSKKVMKAISKYSDRSIVKEFLADLNKNPDFREAMKNKDSNNPMKVMESVGKIKGMNKITMKYALRPEFIKLIMEVVRDPEMKSLIDMTPINATNQLNPNTRSPAEEMENEGLGGESNINFEVLSGSPSI